MRNPEVTVVIPVYNTENLLNRCVESVANQSLEDIEIILVDDGSTDSSLALCREWAKRDKRIKVIEKENGGLSSARNAGVSAASAPFVGFVDSDDFVEPDMFKQLFRSLEDRSADLAICGIRSHYTNQISDCVAETASVISSVNAVSKMALGKELSVCAVVKLYPTDLVRKHPFREGLTYEDVFFLADVYPHIRKVAIVPDAYYNWWHHAGSITTKPFDESSLDVIKAWERCAECFQGSSPELDAAIDFRRIWARFTVLDLILGSSNRSAQDVKAIESDLIEELKKSKDFILSNPNFSKGRKFAFRLLCLHPLFYRLAVKFQSKRVRIYSD